MGHQVSYRRYGAEITKSILSKRQNYYFREIRESCRVRNILFLNLTSLPPISKSKERSKEDRLREYNRKCIFTQLNTFRRVNYKLSTIKNRKLLLINVAMKRRNL